jgi:hypothetical protein
LLAITRLQVTPFLQTHSTHSPFQKKEKKH